MPNHLTLAELHAGIPEILAAPADNGILRAIVIRPEKKERRDLDTCQISLALGTQGDHWAKGRWKSAGDGQLRPDVRACIDRNGDQSDVRFLSCRQIRLSTSNRNAVERPNRNNPAAASKLARSRHWSETMISPSPRVVNATVEKYSAGSMLSNSPAAI